MPNLRHVLASLPLLLAAIPVPAADLPDRPGVMAPYPGKVSCQSLLAMNKVGQITIAMATKEAMHANMNVQAMSDEDVLHIVISGCTKHPKDNVLAAVVLAAVKS